VFLPPTHLESSGPQIGQCCDVQFGLDRISRSRRGSGVDVGRWLACVRKEVNRGRLFWDNASACVLSPPLYVIHICEIQSLPLRKPDTSLDAWCPDHYWNPGEYGYNCWIVTQGSILSFHFLTHNAAALTVGTLSCTAMWAVAMGPTHFNWNHSGPGKVPQPHEPDASDVSVTCGLPWLIAIIMDIPFHDEL